MFLSIFCATVINISCILSCFSLIQSSEWKRMLPILSRNELHFGNRVGVKGAWVNCTHGDSPAHRSCPHMLSSRHTARTLGYTASSHCGRRTAPSCSAALKHNKNMSAWNGALCPKQGKQAEHCERSCDLIQKVIKYKILLLQVVQTKI